jgi:peptidoglycan/xylan/chitin deacetylase (PgdA/CDA1 family)
VLRVLEAHGAKATFFQCGAHVRRRPAIAREIAAAGHELGNHTDTHARLWLRRATFIREELRRAQDSIVQASGVSPVLFRATYGVRWPGLREALRELDLMNIMWTTLARDWVLDAGGVRRRLERGLTEGAIYCLHDARELDTEGDITSTVDALREFLPLASERGYRCVTVSDLIGYSGA